MTHEPAVLIGSIAAVIVAILGAFNVVIEANALETVLLALIPFLSGVATRGKVRPVATSSPRPLH